jgi:lysophospholipase L1-like esterase
MTYYFEKNVGVMNKGVSSNRVADVANRMLSDIYLGYLDKARNIAIIQIGTNDATDGTSAATIFSNIINKLISPMKDAGFEVWLVTVPIRTDNGSALTIIRSLNTLIRADTNADRIIDFYAETVDGTDTAIPGMLQADGLHLTEMACGILAGLVNDEIA